ncbi:MAG: hypothetical protein II870_00150 [Synergistaceae bacterium]|nr:hypothetical protein [Synergistaceae bacterium]
MSDEDFIKRKFKLAFGCDLNLKNPKTFNEKLNWLKLYDRNPEYTRMVDKYEVKNMLLRRSARSISSRYWACIIILTR